MKNIELITFVTGNIKKGRCFKMVKKIFHLELIIFILSIIGIFLSIIFGDKMDIIFISGIILIFSSMWLYCAIKKVHPDKIFVQDLTDNKLIKYLFIILVFIGIISVLGSFVLFVSYGGNVKSFNGLYYVVDNGEILYQITKKEFLLIYNFKRYTCLCFLPIEFLFILYLYRQNHLN